MIDPLLMNAFNNINLAGSCILTSTEYAKELGIPETRWIYPLGGAGTEDAAHCMTIHHSFNLFTSNRLMYSLGTSQLLLQPINFKIIGCRT